MSAPEVRTNLNGTHDRLNIAAPPPASGAVPLPPENVPERVGGSISASTSSQQRSATSFPVEELPFSFTHLLYLLSRCEVLGLASITWLNAIFVGIALLWSPGLLPGRWWVVGGVLLAWLAFRLALYQLRQRNFVTFSEQARPALPLAQSLTLDAAALAAQEKIPVFTTGYFAVERRAQRFTWLPGFYRTFATREHALIAQVAPRSWLGIISWPDLEYGLWYIFFRAESITQVRWGNLHFGRLTQPAIAITCQLTLPTRNRKRPEVTRTETVYIVCQQEQDGQRILADLLYDRPALASQSPYHAR